MLHPRASHILALDGEACYTQKPPPRANCILPSPYPKASYTQKPHPRGPHILEPDKPIPQHAVPQNQLHASIGHGSPIQPSPSTHLSQLHYSIPREPAFADSAASVGPCYTQPLPHPRASFLGGSYYTQHPPQRQPRVPREKLQPCIKK